MSTCRVPNRLAANIITTFMSVICHSKNQFFTISFRNQTLWSLNPFLAALSWLFFSSWLILITCGCKLLFPARSGPILIAWSPTPLTSRPILMNSNMTYAASIKKTILVEQIENWWCPEAKPPRILRVVLTRVSDFVMNEMILGAERKKKKLCEEGCDVDLLVVIDSSDRYRWLFCKALFVAEKIPAPCRLD